MKKRVLVVDDVEFNLEFEQNLIMLYADEAGISVEVNTATTVREAKSKIENNELYDVMVIDMNLPDGSGVDIAKAALAKSDVTRIAAITIYSKKKKKKKK
jgi:CheY-like chemotaxis protein